MKMNKKAYMELIEQDLAYLNNHCQDGSPELDHIKLILCKSIDLYYPEKPKQDARVRAVKAFEYWAHKHGGDEHEIYSLADFMDYYDDDDLHG